MIWGAFANTGVVDGMPSLTYADEHFAELTKEQQAAARRLLESIDLRANLMRKSAQRLEALGIVPNPTNITLAMRLVLDARSQAARELRLGFVQYVDAIRAVGHDVVFPELVAERGGTKKGDVFYRIWWIYSAPLLTGLKRGQALHAARHAFDTELKALEIFLNTGKTRWVTRANTVRSGVIPKLRG